MTGARDPRPATNVYGDALLASFGGYGAEIARQRVDALDRAALERAVRVAPGAALDLGCGEGAQALRFAALGLETLAVDVRPKDATLFGAAPLERALPVRYLSIDARTLTRAHLPARVDLAFSQRFLHHLPYDDALGLLRVLRSVMPPGAALFVSVSGLGSELGEGYAARALPVERRHDLLAPAMRERHGIHGPVCLYEERDLRALGEAASFRAERLFVSEFGNVKAIFVASPPGAPL